MTIHYRGYLIQNDIQFYEYSVNPTKSMKSSQEFPVLPPLSLYVHIPWCVKKCPYCDFNSHAQNEALPIEAYCAALAQDLQHDAHYAQGRKISSIFFGGGTPSLFPASAIGQILTFVDKIVGIESDAEITLEANPGTTEHCSFRELKSAGINRLSIGVQSFNPEHLNTLGRIHSSDEAQSAIRQAQEGGLTNLNIDLMHGLPNQTIDEALNDIELATALSPTHISWYQLTIEKNTEFYSRPPVLPTEDILVDIFEAGQQRLAESGFEQYEISAYAKPSKQSKHNLNYWQFGDYLAIGAGAHGKISVKNSGEIIRFQKTRLPQHYLAKDKSFTASSITVESSQLTLEFMMNALRLNEGVPLDYFCQRTGLAETSIQAPLLALKQKGLLQSDDHRIQTSAMGRLYLNSVLETFLEN